jgi:hypothetical protein
MGTILSAIVSIFAFRFRPVRENHQLFQPCGDLSKDSLGTLKHALDPAAEARGGFRLLVPKRLENRQHVIGASVCRRVGCSISRPSECAAAEPFTRQYLARLLKSTTMQCARNYRIPPGAPSHGSYILRYTDLALRTRYSQTEKEPRT